MSTTPSEIVWNNILKDNVEKDDPLWKEYLDKAAVFDVRMVDEWNKIVDVLLVYVALFISVLTSFIIQTFTQFQRDPADITNDLLVAIYNQLAAQSTSNNTVTSIPLVDPRSYFNQSKADYDAAVVQNALLYTSLSLSIIVSVIALVAKLWLVSYSRQAFSVGSPYDRAMKRQEAYSGLLVWNIGGVINALPVILLIALYLFGFYVYTSVYAVQVNIGHAIGALLSVAVMFLGFTSLGGAFISGCPFRSAFSGVIRLIFEILQILSKWILCGCLSSSKRLRWLWIGILTLLWFASNAAVAYATLISGTWFSLFFSPAAIPIAYSAQQKVAHKPQKYKVSQLALRVFLFVSLSMILAIYYYYPIFILLYGIGVLGIVFACWMMSKMAKSMADTGEIDAIAWLLITSPPQDSATFFKKAGQMTGLDSVGYHYRPRLLESLMPLLTVFINSHHSPEHPSSDAHSLSSNLSFDEDSHLKNLDTYVACLARLSEFTDYEGSLWCLREDAMQHPKLEQPLIDKLVELANPRNDFQVGLRSAATKVLSNYELNMEGNPLTSPSTVMRTVSTVLRTAASNVATVLRSAASSMLNVRRGGLNLNTTSQEEQGHTNLHEPVELATRVEPPHSSTSREIEEA